MSKLPEYLKHGEKARLFPVLADNSKEGRSTSILLSCLANVREFGQVMLSSVNQTVGKLASLATYTEVTFTDNGEEKAHRPDGLIVLKIGKRQWKALFETKIGNAKLNQEQIVSYINLAKKHDIDAVITVSNQFTSRPNHHPVKLSAKTLSKVEIYHWSWMYIFTQADLLISNEKVVDKNQNFILSEMMRFLIHESTGVKSFDRMPPAWTKVVQKVADGAPLQAKSEDIQDIVFSWHQEIRDISLMLTRQINVKVEVKLSRSHISNPSMRAKQDTSNLISKHMLSTELKVQDAAAPIELVVDIGKRTISASMTLDAPGNKKTTKARLNWLLRQMQKTPERDMHIRLNWPGRRACTQHTLKELRENPSTASMNSLDTSVIRFEICMIRQLAKRFSQQKNFINELENLVTEFYKTVGQRLRAYQPPAPRIDDGKTDVEVVIPEKSQNIEK